MSRKRNRNRLVVPEADDELERFKAYVMQKEGYHVNPNQPENVKYEVARSIGVPMKPGYNGKLQAEDAGRVGGQIGGSMVREMIRMAQHTLAQQRGRAR